MADPSSAAQDSVLLVNTRSLKGAEWLEQAKEKLAASGIAPKFSKGFDKPADMFRCIEEEAANAKLVIVGGGDGTLSAAANILMKTDCAMGVLPLGTGNAFARDLGIPTDLDGAVQVLEEGVETHVDLGLCNGQCFLNVVTIGLTASVAKTLTVPLKRRFGRFVYAIAYAKALRDIKSFVAEIKTENGVVRLNAVQLVIGNGHFHGGPLPLSPTAAITSGSLHLYAVAAGSRAELLKYALLLPIGFQGLLKTVHSEDTVGGTVTTEPLQSAVIDGEVSQRTPLNFGEKPLALKVVVPKSFKG